MRYLRNHWSDLHQILESGPDFCKDYEQRDDANQSEHFLHTFCPLFAILYYALKLDSRYLRISFLNQNFGLSKSVLYLQGEYEETYA